MVARVAVVAERRYTWVVWTIARVSLTWACNRTLATFRTIMLVHGPSLQYRSVRMESEFHLLPCTQRGEIGMSPVEGHSRPRVHRRRAIQARPADT